MTAMESGAPASGMGAASGAEWEVVKGKHFIIRHAAGSAAFAQKVLGRAETAYDRIAAALGFAV